MNSTQNQALNAIVFLYKHVLNLDTGRLEGVVRAKKRVYFWFHVPDLWAFSNGHQLLNAFLRIIPVLFFTNLI